MGPIIVFRLFVHVFIKHVMALHVLRSLLVSHREFHRLLGLMESVSSLLPLARVYKRPLQRELAARFPPQPN